MQVNKMSSHWNDDERDTRTSTYHGTPTRSTGREDVTVCQALKDFYRDQRESLYSWTYQDYKQELEKRQARKHILQSPQKQMKVVEREELYLSEEKPIPQETTAEEFNNEIMENEIYKKSWYS